RGRLPSGRCLLVRALRRELLLALGLLGFVGSGLLQARGLLLLHGHLLGGRLLLRALVVGLLLRRSRGRGRRGGLRHREAGRAEEEGQTDEQRDRLSHVFSPPFRFNGSLTLNKVFTGEQFTIEARPLSVKPNRVRHGPAAVGPPPCGLTPVDIL